MKYFANFTLLIAFALMGYMMFMMLYPFKVIDYIQPFQVVTKTVNAGGELRIFVDYCKSTDAPGVLHRSLVGDITYNLANTVSNLPRGCGKSVVPIAIPDYIPSGTYHLRTTTEWNISVLRTVTNTAVSDDFTVVGLPKTP